MSRRPTAATAAIEMRATPAATGGSKTARPTRPPGTTSQNEGDVAVAHMPAIEVQIGEEEDEQRRREHRLGAGPVDALGRPASGKTRWRKPKSMQA